MYNVGYHKEHPEDWKRIEEDEARVYALLDELEGGKENRIKKKRMSMYNVVVMVEEGIGSDGPKECRMPCLDVEAETPYEAYSKAMELLKEQVGKYPEGSECEVLDCHIIKGGRVFSY
jgi:hypothetical protein